MLERDMVERLTNDQSVLQDQVTDYCIARLIMSMFIGFVLYKYITYSSPIPKYRFY